MILKRGERDPLFVPRTWRAGSPPGAWWGAGNNANARHVIHHAVDTRFLN
jgi:hypothetical protein